MCWECSKAKQLSCIISRKLWEGCMQNKHRTTTLWPSTKKQMVLRTLCASWCVSITNEISCAIFTLYPMTSAIISPLMWSIDLWSQTSGDRIYVACHFIFKQMLIVGVIYIRHHFEGCFMWVGEAGFNSLYLGVIVGKVHWIRSSYLSGPCAFQSC
jgi:hypothetical protein